MQYLIRTSVAVAVAMLIFVGSAVADNPGQGPYDQIPADLYISPNNNGFAIPSGQINVVPGGPSTTAVSKDVGPVPDDTTNMLGCAGVGQGEYTSAIYNMPESFSKFQQDADSILSKQLLTMNFALPQTAALFDQLNNYGNQRYQQFQQGCSVDALKQDAKKQYLDACVAKLTPTRKTIITTNLTGDSAPKEPLLSSMAYAQAFEICTNQYVSDTVAFGIRKNINQTFAKQVRDLENVTNAIKPLLCTTKKSDSAPHDTDGCWQTLLIPQVKLCLDDTLGCDAATGYTINEPLLTMPRLFDTLRFIMDDTVVARRITDFSQQIIKNNVSGPIQKQAASEASLLLSNATLSRVDDTGAVAGGGDSKPVGQAAITQPVAAVSEFQLSYLNCKDPDILSPLKVYTTKLNERVKAAGGKGADLALKALTEDLYQPSIDALKLTDADDDQKTALRLLAWTSLGCTANQSVPVFDPLLTASLQTQCLAQDRYAFYSMAGYDVALASTRDIYRYLNLNLKRAYTRLLTQSTVPSATTVGADGSTVSPTISPELNSRLARVVKEVMIPQVEAQIERLDELNATRGQFAQRVQQIYTAKSGCVYGSVLPGGKPLGQGGIGHQ